MYYYIVQIDLKGYGNPKDIRYISSFAGDWVSHFKREAAHEFPTIRQAEATARLYPQWSHYEIIPI